MSRTASALVRAGGRVLGKQELIACGWRDSAASDVSLARCICTVRQRLRLASGGSEIIETLYGRGYRLAVPVARRRAEAPRREPSTDQVRIPVRSMP